MAFGQLVVCAAEEVAGFLGYEGLKEHHAETNNPGNDECCFARLLAITDSNNLYTLSTDEFFYLSYFVHVQCPPQAEQKNTVTIFASHYTRAKYIPVAQVVYARVTRPLISARSGSIQESDYARLPTC